MTDRENLIAIIKDCKTYVAKTEELADHLLANGVTFKKWIPVTERLPKPFELVYVYVPAEQSVTASYITRHKEWVGVRMKCKVTHWMPLPEPPKEA